MNTETISNSTCVVMMQFRVTAYVKYFWHKGDSKYTGCCDLNHDYLTKKLLDLNHN